jgi:hypothetical protein
MLSFLLLILVTILAAVLRWRWRQYPHRAVIATVFLWSIALNYIWEVGQIPLFEGFASASFLTAVWHCAWYTLGDACIVMTLYALGAWVHRFWGWGLRPRWRDGLWLPLAGILVALGMERLALAVGRWAYNSDMPLLPVVEVGLLPVAQMALLPLLSVVLASRFVLRPEPFKR